MISVVIPTVQGRELHLDRCLAAYQATTTIHKLDLIVIEDKPTCGIAWQEGAERAVGDYLHFTADDLEPHPGWEAAACGAVEAGFLPAPRIVQADGSLESCGRWQEEQATGDLTEMTRIPFMAWRQWHQIGPMLPIHYYTDNWISFKGDLANIATRVVREYQFTHHWAQPGRGAGMTEQSRMVHDRGIFERERDKWRS